MERAGKISRPNFSQARKTANIYTNRFTALTAIAAEDKPKSAAKISWKRGAGDGGHYDCCSGFICN